MTNSTVKKIRNVFEENPVQLGKIGKGKKDRKLLQFVQEELEKQALERTTIKILDKINEDSFIGFMEYIRGKGRNRTTMYTYLSSLYPDSDYILVEELKNIIEEFNEEVK